MSVGWHWDAAYAHSNRPDANYATFAGTVQGYSETGELHLKDERGVSFYIPCGHIKDPKRV